MDDLKLQLKGNEHNAYTIHYSCSGFYSGGAVAPTICCIAITNVKTQELHTFALSNYVVEGKCLVDAEKQLLVDFTNFWNSLKNPTLLYWRMDGLEYGFSAILARCENYGLNNVSFVNTIAIDISVKLSSSLQWELEKHQCHCVNMLSGKDEAVCFEKRNFYAVKLSTEAKSVGMAKLINKILKNEIDDDFDTDYDLCDYE